MATLKTTRPKSPSDSMASAQSRDTAVGMSIKSASTVLPSGGKRSIFHRVTGRHKERDHHVADTPPPRTAASSITGVDAGTTKSSAPTQEAKSLRGKKHLTPDARNQLGSKDGRRGHGPFKSTKKGPPLTVPSKPGMALALGGKNSPLWNLDTDLGNMEGIVNQDQMRQQSLMMTPPIMKNEPTEGFPFEMPMDDARQAAWEVPDSWAVKRVPEGGVAAEPTPDAPADEQKVKKDAGPQYFMRIFRADSTFAVISAGLHTTAAELISMMAKKSYLQDDLDQYQMVLRRRGLSRQLAGTERPLQMQKHLLELAGYKESDHLEDLGRDDQGYLCRFTFLSNKTLGYTSLEKDAGIGKMNKFTHIDLSGRNLVTIPIALHQKAAEIHSLNLSRNLALDIPKDFMQSCINLRDVKYTENEAEQLPSGFANAAKLNMVDFSNNRLQSLSSAELFRLSGLISLKLSNNVLTSIPSYFGAYQALRNLVLSSNSLTEFPDFLGGLRTLVELDVSFNSIPSLPCIGKMVNLERLFATNNKITGAFPDNFKNLVSLHMLDVRFNNIENIDVVSALPRLESLQVGHNSISSFEGSFPRLKLFHIDHNPVTRFSFTSPILSLSALNLASAKLTQLQDDLFAKMPNLTRLMLSKNHFVTLSPQIGRLAKLEHLTAYKNELTTLPSEIGLLQNLKFLDVHENNIRALPPEVWYAKRLETLNIASNVLASFPKYGPPPKDLPIDFGNGARHPSATESSSSQGEGDELGKLEGFLLRRPSFVPGMGNPSGSPGSTGALRKGSIASAVSASRNPSLTAKSSTDSGLGTLVGNRKDSTLSNRLAHTFASSLRTLSLADNRLDDDVFVELSLLGELRQLNLSYNILTDMPPRTIKRWPNLTELFLSGNDLTSLPTEDLEEAHSLRALHLNGNKFQVLPGEISKISKLQTLDVSSNVLKYNVANWPYDWNWNFNPKLRYLNLSGNKRMEIKQHATVIRGETQDLTDFTTLTNLRVLGLMDVTLPSALNSVPDESADRRVRTAGTTIGTSINYGIADTLGRAEHVSTFDLVIPTFQGHDDRYVFGLFDGQMLNSGGSRVARYLQTKFRGVLADELDKLKISSGETPVDALRRTYLGLNKELATIVNQVLDMADQGDKPVVVRGASANSTDFSEDDAVSGAVATVCYLHGEDLYVSNVGDAQALLVNSEGSHSVVTQKHDPAETGERRRIKQAGGFVSRQGKLNDVLEISRAFGYVQLTPVVTAAPHVSHITIKDGDEMIILASRDLWDYLTFDLAVDIARFERGDLMIAAQKLRDLAIAFGASSSIMVMIIGVSELNKKRERAKFRTHSMSMGPSGVADDYFATTRRKGRGRDAVGDSKLARLDQEVDAPTDAVSLVFTDIKNSTMLWETHYEPMRSAIKLHNEVMRRQLRIIGGYEVKTEGDAFMVAFPTVTSALLWCFSVQSQLLEVQWPQEITNSIHGQTVYDDQGRVIFRGLSVRMGIHWGRPVCEVDPVTKRMDYFGPMVNRAARISSVADGGQITVSKDFIEEIQTLLEATIENERRGSTGSDETLSEDVLSLAHRRELHSLKAQGFEVKDLGMRTLKGLENPEYIYSMYPHCLAARRHVLERRQTEAASDQLAASTAALPKVLPGGPRYGQSQVFEKEIMYELWAVSLRLEMLCSTLECTGSTRIKVPELGMLNQMRQEDTAAISSSFLFGFVEHQVARIEVSGAILSVVFWCFTHIIQTCITTLTLRNMVRPFSGAAGMLATACPMGDIMHEIGTKLDDLRSYKEADMNKRLSAHHG